ncbi:hypothetical protein IAD21_02999 [Abditibacteriota bacterium]|nr:hypothetical protein IAD21_02999 [Abditibacteriota bacterium]
MDSEPDFLALWKRAQREFKLKGSLHGPDHWRRVEANGVLLAEQTGADLIVVRLFALFHDCKRQNDDDDPEHGRRAANFLSEQRPNLLSISDNQFALLREATAYHADGTTHHNPTIGTCWDSDRLDLTRCGLTPAPQFFSTMAGRAEARKRKA